jgi:maltose alpha-D-glucosyltransferase/alpha-amylase
MAPRSKTRFPRDDDPFWYKDAIFYELRVRAFYDSDGDGIGDFRGLAERLDYLSDLGVTTLWLLPFSPSPFRDDGYDISDYTGIDRDCGTLEDFKHFLREAHRRDLRVVTELVINHTSDQHPWFQRARRSPPGSRWRNYYVWSDTPEKYGDVRVIFKDFEPSNWTWDPVAKAYYWHRFYSHQPDLNFEHPEVQRAVFRFLDFWLKLGVDGLRLDAIPYLYEREGTSCENLPETHAFLKELRRHVDQKYRGRMLLAEANQWSEDAVQYFGNGDECHMCFHFPVMPRLFMALHMEDRFPIFDILTQTPDIPESCQWALFLRNHDELTLEMVTDEERDYMYRVYAHDAQARINLGIRRRLAPLLGNDRRRIELMNALLFSLPGTPVIYYGDEIGMGDNFYLGDRNGVRTPMQWSGDRNAGFSRANPQRLYLPPIIDPEYHYESRNVETQQNNVHSLLFWMKRLIALRKRYKAFGRGKIEFLSPRNRKVIAFIRHHEEERILVVANLSRYVEYVELDLSPFKEMRVVELFGRQIFPPIGDLPYLLTLGPHSFYWFSLEAPSEVPQRVTTAEVVVRVEGSWENALRNEGRVALQKVLPQVLQTRRWFGSKALSIKSASVVDVIPIPCNSSAGAFALVRVDYVRGGPETYGIPLMFAEGEQATRLRRESPQAAIAELEVSDKHGSVRGVLYDALHDNDFCLALLDTIARRRQFKGGIGEIFGSPTRVYRRLAGSADPPLSVSSMKGEQSNTSVVFGNQLILKLYRRLAEGVNPEWELGRFLAERTNFAQVSPVAGAVEYRVPRREPITLAVLHGFVENEGDAWRYTTDQVKSYFERALVLHTPTSEVPVPREGLLDLTDENPPALVSETIGAYLETARLLGRRTAELHLALASSPDDPGFAPEPFTSLYQRSLYQSMRNLTNSVFHLLREKMDSLPAGISAEAKKIAALEDRVLQACRAILSHKIRATRLRYHGDFHLGQVLYTGKDFVIIDFEGEPARSLSERRLKRSPLRDVAGMLRSFDYAVHSVLLEGAEAGSIRPQDHPMVERWARFWRAWVSSGFLRAYLRCAGDASFVPKQRAELESLLHALLLEKSIYELGYELNNRPAWLPVPIRGIVELLQG